MATTLGRLHDRISAAGLWLAIAALAAIVLVSFSGTFSRYLFNAPLGWVPDWSGYLMAAAVFLAAPEVARRRMNIAMEVLPTALAGTRAGVVLAGVGAVVTLVILGTISWIVAEATLSTYRSGTATAAGYPIPRWWLFSVILYGFGSSALHILRQCAGLLRPAPQANPGPAASTEQI